MNALFYSLHTIDYPNSVRTGADGINDLGEIVGAYSPASLESSSFLLDRGGYTSVEGDYSQANGVNNLGEIVGIVKTSVRAPPQGWIDQNGTVTPFDVPVGPQTDPAGINDYGEIVGSYFGGVIGGSSALAPHGFVYRNGQFYTFDVPDSVTSLLGVNDRGEIVGTYIDAGDKTHSFLYADGTLSQIAVPGAASTTVSALNNFGEIVGTYADASGATHGFVDAGGHYATFDVPGATSLAVSGVNDFGQIVGTYTGAAGYYGFVADPNGLGHHAGSDTIRITLDAVGGGSPGFLQGLGRIESRFGDAAKFPDGLTGFVHRNAAALASLAFGPAEPLISASGNGLAYFPGVTSGSAAFTQLSEAQGWPAAGDHAAFGRWG